MNFKTDKNGYNASEVDAYIRQLKSEYDKSLSEQKIRISDLKRELNIKNAELLKYKSKNSDISNALIVAVETAKQIENSSKNVYSLEIQRLKSLYTKWDKVLDDFMKEYPQLAEKFDSKKLLKQLSDKIDEVIEQNKVDTKVEPQKQPIGIRNLISKMGGITARQISDERPMHHKPLKSQENYQVINSDEYEEDLVEQTEKTPREEQNKNNFELKIKPIANMKPSDKAKFDNMIEEFFNVNDEQEDNAYSKELIRSKKQVSGFDLKEALNPTEDLAEIMKDFGFLDDDDKK